MPDEKPAVMRPESLDEIVSHSAAIFAEQLQKAAAWAQSEADLQIEAAGFLKEFARRAQITLEGHHNITIATGRPDSVYSRVIVEYKDPGTLSANKDSAGNQKLIKQLRDRFYDLKREQNQNWNSLFGVGTDGKYFIFLRFRDDKWTDQEPLPVDRHSAERFLWALYNLGQKGKPYQPEYLHGDFGSESTIAQDGVRTLYEEILHTENPKAQVFFSQWKILFGEVCGYDVENLSDKLKKLAEFYVVKGKPQPAPLLFAVHTYYAILIKLLAADVVSFFYSKFMPRQVERLINATTSGKLKRELEVLEQGGIFGQLGITNFLEGDLFSWYLAEWTEAAENVVRRMITKLDEYNPGTFSEDPVQSRDLLKKLYQQLFPKSVRHDLGEYYTPDWLAEHVLNELGYEGDPDKRILDPACGSGTFLVMAINRVRRWYEQNREKCAYDEGDLLKKILANVIGFDLNPLAVMAARTNYLVAIKDLIRHADHVEIPVYLCDSIMTPAEYGDLFTGAGNVAKVPCSAMKPPHLLVPKEIANSPKEVATYAAVLETCIKNGYKPEEFLTRCQDEGLNITATDAHIDLYKELVRLDKENKNGIWARIIKNNFAPLFAGMFDHVAGNPPWINWESLPADYRDGTLGLWDKYRLRERAIPGARLGNVKKELSALFVYVCLDHYVVVGGSLGFVITQSVFKTGANEGFRRFTCGDGKPFMVSSVSDLSLFLPFENAINRTATFVARKGEATAYPVAYRLWVPRSDEPANDEVALDSLMKEFEVHDWLASPVEPSVRESTWLTAARKALPTLEKVVGDRSSAIMDRTYAGSCTWLNGAFWVEEVKADKHRVLIKNMGDVGKIKLESVVMPVESEFLFPLLRGRDVHAWHAQPSAMIVLPHRADDFSEPVDLAEMKRKLPLTFEFFKRFEKQLKARSGYKQLHKQRPEFYVVGNVGNYTLSPYKVVFKDLTEMFQCAVVGSSTAGGPATRPVVPDHTLLFLTFDLEAEAYFVAGLLNSLPVKVAVYSASIGVQTQRYFPTDVSRVRMPEFNPENSLHREVVRISKALHEMPATNAASRDRDRREMHLAATVAPLWNISPGELKHLLSYYEEIRSLRSGVTAGDGEGDE